MTHNEVALKAEDITNEALPRGFQVLTDEDIKSENKVHTSTPRIILEDLQRGGAVLKLLEFIEALPPQESDCIRGALQVLEKHSPGKWKKYDGYSEADYDLDLQSSVPSELAEMERQGRIVALLHTALGSIIKPSQYFIGSSFGVGIANNIRSGQHSTSEYIELARNDELSNIESLICAGLNMHVVEVSVVDYITKYQSLPKESEYGKLAPPIKQQHLK